MPPATVRELLAGLVDYAGLFPPAALSMRDAAAEYAAQRRSAHAWALGRFVVPAARLAELSAALHEGALIAGDAPWRVSALVGENAQSDVAAIRRAAGDPVIELDCVEARASSRDDVMRLASALDGPWTIYLELPHEGDPAALIEAVGTAGVRAKIRTGGTTAAAFPTAAQVARFITRCAAANVAFKATAGLHHPLRAEYRLTYADDAPVGTMFGFLGVFLAACFARAGMSEATLADLLEEREPSAFQFDDDAVRWRGHSIARAEIARTRSDFATSFGSCSFAEPVHDLLRIQLL